MDTKMMLTVNEFINMMKEVLKDRLPEGTEITGKEVIKNNDQVHTGIVIKENGATISPTIYCDLYCDEYNDGRISAEEVADKILKVYKESKRCEAFDGEKIQKWETAKEKIVPKLISKVRNKELLKGVPYVEVLGDLAVVFRYIVTIVNDEIASILITEEHADFWKVTKEELYKKAIENAEKLFPEHDEYMGNVLGQLTGVDMAECANMPIIQVVSNEKNINGAAVILYPGVAEMVAKKVLNSDEGTVAFIPSSVHEFLCLAADTGMLPVFEDMIKSVNETEVSAEEVLGDHAYLYTIGKGFIL